MSHAAKAPLPSSYWHLARQLPIYFLRPKSVCTPLREGLNVATILIVEDDREIRALAQSLIEEQGHKTLSAATLDEALAILSGSEVVDALFVDIILKGEMQAGIELAKRAVEHKPDLKVLYSTGLAVTDDIKALVVPGSTILEKPYSETSF